MAVRRMVKRRDVGESNGKWWNTRVRSIAFFVTFYIYIDFRNTKTVVWRTGEYILLRTRSSIWETLTKWNPATVVSGMRF